METVPDGKRFSNTYNLKKSLAFAFADTLRDMS